jgi:uncharacterized membrane protein YphA (DoxX/SURF4 family)
MHTVLNKLPVVARILLGLVFFVFGLNGFLNFLPAPPQMDGPAGAFMGALAATKYMFPLIKATEVVAGLLLLVGRFVPLGLTLLAPVIVNIAAFHIFLSPGLAMVAFLVIAEVYLAWAYRDAFRGMLQADAKPRSAEAATPTRAAGAAA